MATIPFRSDQCQLISGRCRLTGAYPSTDNNSLVVICSSIVQNSSIGADIDILEGDLLDLPGSNMIKPSSLRLVLILAGAMALMGLVGCRKLPTFFEQPAPKNSQPTPTVTPRVAAPVDLSSQAVKTVTDYLTALTDHQYASAYMLLSRDSQSKHSRADFEQHGKQEMPLYDLKTAKATVTGDQALVVVQLLEDPATHGFNLVREDENWKIVYWGGVPGVPYAK